LSTRIVPAFKTHLLKALLERCSDVIVNRRRDALHTSSSCYSPRKKI
jgi:hypothetical protein